MRMSAVVCCINDDLIHILTQGVRPFLHPAHAAAAAAACLPFYRQGRLPRQPQ